MAVFSEEDRRRLGEFLLAGLTPENAGDMERFAVNVLHNSKVWDLLAESFPDAPVSVIKSAMMDAYASWSRKA